MVHTNMHYRVDSRLTHFLKSRAHNLDSARRCVAFDANIRLRGHRPYLDQYGSEAITRVRVLLPLIYQRQSYHSMTQSLVHDACQHPYINSCTMLLFPCHISQDLSKHQDIHHDLVQLRQRAPSPLPSKQRRYTLDKRKDLPPQAVHLRVSMVQARPGRHHLRHSYHELLVC